MANATPRLPSPGSDDGTWGDVLNDYLRQSHNDAGGIKPGALTAAGGYIKPGTGIPSTDLTTSAQTSLSKADSAMQAADISGKADTSAVLLKTNNLSDLPAPATARTNLGIPSLPSSLLAGQQNLGSVSGTVNVSLTSGWTFSATITANTTFNFTNLPASGTVAMIEGLVTQGNPGNFTVAFTNAGSAISVSWDTSVGMTVATQAGATTVFNLQTGDAGATWYGTGQKIRLDQANTWSQLQTMNGGIALPSVTMGTTTTGTITLPTAVTDAAAATAMGISTAALVNGMTVFDTTSATIAVRFGSNLWTRLRGMDDNNAFTRPFATAVSVAGANTVKFFTGKILNPGSTPADAQDRIQLSTDSSGNSQVLLGPGTFSADVGMRRTGNGLIQAVGRLVAASGAPFQTATQAGGWTDAAVTSGTVADGIVAADTTANTLNYRTNSSWYAIGAGLREQDALAAQNWLAWDFDSAEANNNLTPVSGSIYALRIAMPKGGTVTNIILGLISAGATFTASQSYVGLYNAAGTLLSSSADMGTASYFGNGAAGSGYALACPLTTPQTVTAGQVVYAVFLATATTMPHFAGRNNGVSGPYSNGYSGYRRSGVAGTGATSLPPTIAPTTLSVASIGYPFIALS